MFKLNYLLPVALVTSLAFFNSSGAKAQISNKDQAFLKEIETYAQQRGKTVSELSAENHLESAQKICTAIPNQGVSNSFEKLVSGAKTAFKVAQSAQQYYKRGEKFYEQGNQHQAIKAFTRAIELNSNYADAYFDRGIAYYELEEYEEAISDYNQAIDINPDYAYPYYERGNVYYELEEYEKAISDYNQAIDNNISITGIHYKRGNAYYKLEEYEKAISDYNQILEDELLGSIVSSENAEAYYKRGNAYYNLEQYKQARSDLKQAAKLFQKLGNKQMYRETMEQLEEWR